MSKICGTCGQELSQEEFYKCGYTKSGVQRYAFECKSCRKAREMKRYYDLADAMMKYKTACVHCGEQRPYLIEFHHRNPAEKEFSISQWRKHSKIIIEEELQKCDPLCKNCHAEFHYMHEHLGLTYTDYIQNS